MLNNVMAGVYENEKKIVWFVEILLIIIGVALIFNQQISDLLVGRMTATDLKQSISQKHEKRFI